MQHNARPMFGSARDRRRSVQNVAALTLIGRGFVRNDTAKEQTATNPAALQDGKDPPGKRDSGRRCGRYVLRDGANDDAAGATGAGCDDDGRAAGALCRWSTGRALEEVAGKAAHQSRLNTFQGKARPVPAVCFKVKTVSISLGMGSLIFCGEA